MPFDPPSVAYQIGTSRDEPACISPTQGGAAALWASERSAAAYDFVGEAARLRDRWQGADTFGREADKRKIRVLIETRHYLRAAAAHRGLFNAIARARAIKNGRLETKVLRFIHGMSVETSRTGVVRFGAILGWLREQPESDADLWERVRPLNLGQLETLAKSRQIDDDWCAYWGVGGNETEWYTPKAWIKILGPFDLDPSSPNRDHWTAARHLTQEDDGLAQDWGGVRVFCNPPFGRKSGMDRWAAKFIENANGIMLTPDNTSTGWFQKLVSSCDMVLFVNRKIKFIGPNGEAGCSFPRGTALFAMGEECVRGLIRAHRAGMGVLLRSASLASPSPKGRQSLRQQSDALVKQYDDTMKSAA